MQFNVLTMYPELIKGYLDQSYLKRAIDSEELKVNVINQRDSHKNFANIYDYSFGGGPGLLMRVDNFHLNMEKYLKDSHTIIFSPKGKKLDQRKMYQLTKIKKPINLICSRFEGYDKRIETYCDDVISLGDFVISGSEIGAIILIEGTYRLYGKEIKNKESIIEDSFGLKGEEKYEYDQFTRPRKFQGKKVPEELVSGNHSVIKEWRSKNKKK